MGRRAKSVEQELVRAKGIKNAESVDKESTSIIDTKLLEQRKQRAKKKYKHEETVNPTPREPQWWEKTVAVEDFKIAEHAKHFYARLEYWKPNIWIGAYSTKEELLKVIEDYSKFTRSKSKRKKSINNLHSVIIDIK